MDRKFLPNFNNMNLKKTPILTEHTIMELFTDQSEWNELPTGEYSL